MQQKKTQSLDAFTSFDRDGTSVTFSSVDWLRQPTMAVGDVLYVPDGLTGKSQA